MNTLAELKIAGPTITTLTEPFWQAACEGKLMLQHCEGCNKTVFYPRALCPHCWSDTLEWKQASGKGRLKSFSEIWKPGHPGWIPAAPYIVGLVEFAEGPTMLSLILTGDQQVAVGDAVHFAPTNVGGRVLPCFKLKPLKEKN